MQASGSRVVVEKYLNFSLKFYYFNPLIHK